MKKYFQIFSNCIITRGFSKSIISDLQRNNSVFIPNSLYDVINLIKDQNSIKEIYKFYGKDNKDFLDEYFSFLVEEEFGFYCDFEDLKNFPEIDTTFYSPSSITNIVIECKKNTIDNLLNIILQLEKIKCKDVVLIFYEPLFFNDLLLINSFFKGSIVKSVEIVCEFSSDISYDEIKKISIVFERLTSISMFSSPQKKQIYWNNEVLCDVNYIENKITDFKFCGGVNQTFFNTNMKKIFESLNHNSCLHKKISIDINGNIKNCPSMQQNFGNIKNVSLEEAINYKGFKKYWNLAKDNIEVCRDCEFRYICTDCRAYTERTHFNKDGLDISKPLKCGYNPYTEEWEDWSVNPLKSNAIKYYGFDEN